MAGAVGRAPRVREVDDPSPTVGLPSPFKLHAGALEDFTAFTRLREGHLGAGTGDKWLRLVNGHLPGRWVEGRGRR